MLTLFLRFVVLGIGLFATLLAVFSWRFGDPPTWTVFLPSQSAMVLSSETRTYRIGNGTWRTSPHVEVAWPTDADRLDLKGLVPDFFAYGPAAAGAIAADYVPGEAARVVIYDNAPYADRLGWFRLLHAGFLTMLALVLVPLGLLIARSVVKGIAATTRLHLGASCRECDRKTAK